MSFSISTSFLEKHNACEVHITLFRQTFPDSAETGVPVTAENWELAKNAGLDLFWLHRTLPEAEKVQFQIMNNSAAFSRNTTIDKAFQEYKPEIDRIAEEFPLVYRTSNYNEEERNEQITQWNNARRAALAKYDAICIEAQRQWREQCIAGLFSILQTL
ncbi:MAG: hypothetical protein K2Z81_17295 [Cyanobacteria bacterium]|nr:hypothetical protein [Cyanobacteriota bacterium]